MHSYLTGASTPIKLVDPESRSEAGQPQGHQARYEELKHVPVGSHRSRSEAKLPPLNTWETNRAAPASESGKQTHSAKYHDSTRSNLFEYPPKWETPSDDELKYNLH